MEEVDHIIIHSLRVIGCDIEEDVTNLKQFSTELIVSAVIRCLKVINSDVDLPNSLPGGMSAKFRIGTSMAAHIQELGYRGEIGYQTFLYSNEQEIRRVLMFLVDKLPKETAEAVEEVLGASVLLQRTIASTLAQQLNSVWTPPYLKQNSITWRGSPPHWQREGASSLCKFHASHLHIPQGMTDLKRKLPKALRSYYSQSLPYVTNQTVHHNDTSSSVIEKMASEITAQQEWENEWNQAGLASRLSEQEYREKKKNKIRKRVMDQLRQDVQRSGDFAASRKAQDLQQMIDSISSRAGSSTKTKGSRFTHTEQLIFAKDEEKTMSQMGGESEVGQGHSEEEIQNQRDAEVEGLREEVSGLVSRLEQMDLEMRKFTASIQQMEEVVSTQGSTNAEKEEAYTVKKRTLDLLPDAENNIAKLQSVVDGSAQRLVTLANQWEKHRAPLIDQYRELKDLSSKKESEGEKKLEEIKAFRVRMKEVADDARHKDEHLKQLVAEYERMTKDVNRSAYTQRIMEIVSNIKKQKDGINTVLIDTRAVQKEINQLTGKLDRTFTVTDELIFRNAKKDEAAKKAYRHLAALHESCELLISTVEETGVIMREIRELEDQIENESKNKVLSNLEKITSDYQQMKKENTALMAKMKQRS
ncbi:coiled-coil domain-containing protein 22 homolog [Mizuhopecten yessoensis]|uniref:Coiled-coil domain-containing protein 22-like n=1 Tax=Mizuhopecten yessoensis TaxID=6573 RepID=A0A210QFW3_MIZYE|nr:coiled-coil domain-containing protein 22 homolog [Mizuhopecten yessoensis]OWF47632.1 Coiled-coil domain-containing protein 22-like [Mizuhopecten yessoensis]